jgi:hypothetical protein
MRWKVRGFYGEFEFMYEFQLLKSTSCNLTILLEHLKLLIVVSIYSLSPRVGGSEVLNNEGMPFAGTSL